MAKLFCLLCNHNYFTEENAKRSLDYNHGWQKRFYRDEDITLGCFELPFKKEEDFWLNQGDFVLILDGEIFTWSRLIDGKTTMEKLLNLFKMSGEDTVKYINGNFSLLVWDKKQRVMSIVNDRMGLRPLYYSQYKDKVFFSSEIKAIISDPDFEKEFDMEGVIDFFSYEYILENKTLLKRINVFPYASTLKVHAGKTELIFKRYWDFSFKGNSPERYSEEDYLFKFKEVINQAIERNIKGDLKVGVPLSGGLDSRMIATFVRQKGYFLHTFTFGEKGSEDEKYARRIARTLGTEHHYVGIKYDRLVEFIKRGVFYCDGLVSCRHYHILNILDEMQKYVKVGLDGFVGDTLSGARMYGACINKDGEFIQTKVDVFGERLRSNIFSKDLSREIMSGKESFLSLWNKIQMREEADPYGYFSLTQRQRRFTNYGKVNMRNSLEVRMPFTDYDFMDFCIKLPDIFKKNQALYKRIFTKYFPEIAKIPQQGKGLTINPSRLEKAVRWRMKLLQEKFKINPKVMCSYQRWYKTVLRDFVCSTLLSKRFKDRRLFDYRKVEELLNEHFQGIANYEVQIGVLLTFEIWNRLFLENENQVLYKNKVGI